MSYSNNVVRTKLIERIEQLEKENYYLRKQIVKLGEIKQSPFVKAEAYMIEDAIFETTGFTISDLRSQSKTAYIMIVKQVYIYMLHKYAFMNFTQMARYMSRHHTSIIYTIDRVNSWLRFNNSYPQEMQLFNNIENQIIEKLKTV
jgi:chromosomal replication initiation ATPase DnaA